MLPLRWTAKVRLCHHPKETIDLDQAGPFNYRLKDEHSGDQATVPPTLNLQGEDETSGAPFVHKCREVWTTPPAHKRTTLINQFSTHFSAMVLLTCQFYLMFRLGSSAINASGVKFSIPQYKLIKFSNILNDASQRCETLSEKLKMSRRLDTTIDSGTKKLQCI